MNKVLISRISGPLGDMLAAATEKGLCYLDFVDEEDDASHVKVLARCFGNDIGEGKNTYITGAGGQLAEYFSGKRRTFDIPLDVPGTTFQTAVWNALLSIPYGEKRTYKQQAEAIGRPKAVRAVARANGANRISIIIPCHRVLGSDGTLTGYAGGLWRKQYLLDLESKGFPGE